MLRRTAIVALLLGTVGAGASGTVRDPSLCPGTCPRSIAYSLDPRFSADERLLIGQAMNVWEVGTGGRVCFRPGGRDLVVERLDRSDELEPWDPQWPHHVALTKGSRIWVVAPRIEDRGEYRGLIVHELGHHLGIGHIEDTRETYMHSTINDTPPDLWLRPRLPPRDGRAFCEVHECTCNP